MIVDPVSGIWVISSLNVRDVTKLRVNPSGGHVRLMLARKIRWLVIVASVRIFLVTRS